MAKPNDLHHLAMMTGDIKTQIEFFTDVLGMELSGFYNLHGVEAGYHAFLTLHENCTFAFVQIPGNSNIEPIWGVSHGAQDGTGVGAPGTMHHVSLNVDTYKDLLDMRDRIRSRGITVVGPVDHGCFRSIYFGAPENITMEISTSEDRSFKAENWVDPEVAEKNGISPEELQRYMSPEDYEGQGGAVPQPEYDPSKPRVMGWPEEAFLALSQMDEATLTQIIGEEKPPIPSP